MRTLSETLLAAQKAYSKNPLYKVVLTNGGTSYTYDKDRILPSSHDEGMYSQKAIISLDNSDHEFDDKDLKGFDAVISYGYKTPAGNEYLESAALVVMDPQFDSDPNKLTCTLELWGIPDLMAEDKASGNYIPDSDATETVKGLINAIAGATLSPFTHCKAYEVVWESGYDTLADTYQPKDGFRIYTRGTRLAAFRRLMDYTGNVPRFGADGKIHILKPVTTGTTFDYEYSLAKGAHVFFRKAYRDSLVIPNRVVVQSRSDDDPFYSGSAQVSNYASLPDKVKKTDFIECPLASNAQATAIAEALIAKAEMGSKRGEAPVPLNIGAEVFDYVKITDSRQGDSRTGNLGYVHRRFGPDKWEMTFGFGNWLEMLRYNAILKQLETYTDAGQYFNRLTVKDLYAEHIQADSLDMVWIDPDGNIDLSLIGDTLDNLPDGEVYARVKSMHLDAGVLQLNENVVYKAGYDPNTKRRNFTATPTTPYDLGDMWTDGTVLKRCTTARATGAYVAGDWTQVGLDAIADGSVYHRVKSAALSADGLVLLDQVTVGTYGLVKATDISAGHIKLSTCSGDLDDIDNGTTYGKVELTDISSGHIKLTTNTVWSGKVTVRSGVTIDSAGGINIWGLDNALTTRATETGTIQCYVGSDGAIYAGAGGVKLSSTGIAIIGTSQLLRLYYNAATYAGYFGITSSALQLWSTSDYDLDIHSGEYLRLIADTGIYVNAPFVSMGSNVGYMILPLVTSDPTGSEGMMCFRTDLAWGSKVRIYSGGAWRNFQLT
ncbi:MAG: hypothetical protein MUP81_06600 [Dehalococcoidia bacterium]|nr:hypothetical protein [Dehalococcoidia bacterium]